MDPPHPDSNPTPSITTTTTTTTTTNNNAINPNPNPNSNINNNNNNRDQFLRHLTHLNKLSHKITKPTNRQTEPPVHPPQTQQPPVYNINKSDFRDVVQKLTGSPSHAPSSTQPTLHAPKPNSSRLQRIRPPPLAPLISPSPGFGSGLGQMSPLPPLPMCHASAESPISAYMRFLHSAIGNNSIGMMFPPPENLENVPPMDFTAGESSSTVSFGRFPSPKSPCQLLSPKLVLPLSPTVSAPSPK